MAPKWRVSQLELTHLMFEEKVCYNYDVVGLHVFLCSASIVMSITGAQFPKLTARGAIVLGLGILVVFVWEYYGSLSKKG